MLLTNLGHRTLSNLHMYEFYRLEMTNVGLRGDGKGLCFHNNGGTEVDVDFIRVIDAVTAAVLLFCR